LRWQDEDEMMAGSTKPLVVVADDDLQVVKTMEQVLREWDYRVVALSAKARLLEQLAREMPRLLLMDLQFGSPGGIEQMRELLHTHTDLVVVILTGHGTIDAAVSAIKWGAYDFLTKPPDWNRLKVILSHVVETDRLQQSVKRLQQLIERPDGVHRLVGASPSMARLRELIETVAAPNATVLILGESGTGKELVARAVHDRSPRRQAPFVPVNMAALPRELVESTLFGHKKGAFTGADQNQVGCCELADKGTLFLDEIGEMELQVQAKLLRLLQEHTFQPVGASKTQAVDVRVVAATNRDLEERVRAGLFREDLYYRLKVVPLVVPPLRERAEDVGVLANRFLQRAAVRYRKETNGFTGAALTALASYRWPGNVRELENMVERLVILATGEEIALTDLPAEVRGLEGGAALALERAGFEPEPALRRIDQLEKEAILDVLHRARGNVREAAHLLGLGQATVYRKIKRYAIALTGRDRNPIAAPRPTGREPGEPERNGNGALTISS
jgi:DNA-binding NtrC family response regulator